MVEDSVELEDCARDDEKECKNLVRIAKVMEKDWMGYGTKCKLVRELWMRYGQLRIRIMWLSYSYLLHQ